MFNPEIDLTLEEEAAMTLDKKNSVGYTVGKCFSD